MAPEELPLRCLAVHVVLDATGEIDSLELETFLDAIAGRDQRISTTEWLFVEPPAEAGAWVTVPVVVPEKVAVHAILNDLKNDPQRILFDHQTSPVEKRRWRWVAFQSAPNSRGKGRFPWEPPRA